MAYGAGHGHQREDAGGRGPGRRGERLQEEQHSARAGVGRAGPHAGGVRLVRPVLGAGGGDLRLVLVPPALARAGDTYCWGLDAWRDSVAGAVVGFDCYLRFAVAVATFTVPARVPPLKRLGKLMNDHPVLATVLGIVGGGMAVAAFYVLIEGICCWMESKIRPINNAPVVPVAGPAAVRAEVEMEMNPPQQQPMVI